MNLVPTDKEGLFRDISNKAILSKDVAALSAYKLQRQKAKEFEDMKLQMSKLDKLETEIDDIKNKLNELLERLNAGNSR